MSAIYERELKNIFYNTYEYVSNTKKEQHDHLKKMNVGIIRGAGSLGIDLIAIRNGKCLAIEVKSSKRKAVYFSSDQRVIKQYNDYVDLTDYCNIPILYMLRKKNLREEKWEVFRLDSKYSLEYFSWVPTIPKTPSGHPFLAQNAGLNLSDFILRISDYWGETE